MYSSYQSYQPTRHQRGPSRPPKPPKQRGPRGFYSIAFLIIIIVTSYIFLHNHDEKIASKDATPVAAEAQLKLPQETQLKDSLGAIIAQHSYKIGVAVTDVSTGHTLTAGSTDMFTAGSTTKLFTAAAYYHLVETGKATLDQQVGNWPASFQLHELVNISDNDSWTDLKDVITRDGLSDYIHSLGITYDEPNNAVAPSEMSQFLAKFYSAKAINRTDTKTILGDMQNTNMEQMIPAVTPSSITVYHKYGLYNGTLADVGILTDGKNSYAVAIYTQNTDDSDDLARISVIRSLAAAIITNVFPGTTPLTPPAPTSIND